MVRKWLAHCVAMRPESFSWVAWPLVGRVATLMCTGLCGASNPCCQSVQQLVGMSTCAPTVAAQQVPMDCTATFVALPGAAVASWLTQVAVCRLHGHVCVSALSGQQTWWRRLHVMRRMQTGKPSSLCVGLFGDQMVVGNDSGLLDFSVVQVVCWPQWLMNM